MRLLTTNQTFWEVRIMAENYLPNTNKKANRNSNLFKFSRKLKKFDVSAVSVLEQTLRKLETGKTLNAEQSFDALFKETEMLKALAFMFANLTLNEDSDYNDEVKSGVVAMLESIAENIERFAIVFGNHERITEIKI
jgi:hypothetical protein